MAISLPWRSHYLGDLCIRLHHVINIEVGLMVACVVMCGESRSLWFISAYHNYMYIPPMCHINTPKTHTHTHTHSHSLSHPHTHSLTHSLTHSPTHKPTLTTKAIPYVPPYDLSLSSIWTHSPTLYVKRNINSIRKSKHYKSHPEGILQCMLSVFTFSLSHVHLNGADFNVLKYCTCICVCVCLCMYVCVCACMCACTYLSLCMCVLLLHTKICG